jgi:acyl CoA:acetate/3-ketoacid CoA transferase alpha subunit
VDKVVRSGAEAVADIRDGSSWWRWAVSGLRGIPHVLIQALYELGNASLETVSNNCGWMRRAWGVAVRGTDPAHDRLLSE